MSKSATYDFENTEDYVQPHANQGYSGGFTSRIALIHSEVLVSIHFDGLQTGVVSVVGILQRMKKSPTTKSCWAQYTIKGEINETKPTILSNIYLHKLRLRSFAKVPALLKINLSNLHRFIS